MQSSPAEIKTVQKFLAATPRRIAARSLGVADSQLHFRPDKDAWSANDILAHLRAAADVWGKSILAMRYDLLKSLKALSLTDWSRGATFRATIKGREQSVFSYAQRIAQHETEHLGQMEDLLKGA